MNQIRYLLFILALVSFADITGQPYKIGTSSWILRDPERGNRRIPLTVYYPAMDEGTDVPLALKNHEKFPVICFAHGYLLGMKNYMNICEALVPEGFILLMPEPEGGLFPSHKSQAEDLVFVLEHISELDQTPSSLFFSRIDSMQCLMGFSMGGGASFVAANQNSNIQALIALAPYDTRPSAIQTGSSVTIPTLIIAGSKDCITPPEEHQVPMYHSTASLDKTLIQIKGGNHCQMVDKSSACNFGESVKGCKPGISRAEQHRIINKYLVPWLHFYLNGSNEAGRQFNMDIQSDTTIIYQRSRPLSVHSAKSNPQ